MNEERLLKVRLSEHATCPFLPSYRAQTTSEQNSQSGEITDYVSSIRLTTFRLAHRIRDMQNLPYVVVTEDHIAQVYQLYWEAFEKFVDVDPFDAILTSFQT